MVVPPPAPLGRPGRTLQGRQKTNKSILAGGNGRTPLCNDSPLYAITQCETRSAGREREGFEGIRHGVDNGPSEGSCGDVELQDCAIILRVDEQRAYAFV